MRHSRNLSVLSMLSSWTLLPYSLTFTILLFWYYMGNASMKNRIFFINHRAFSSVSKNFYELHKTFIKLIKHFIKVLWTTSSFRRKLRHCLAELILHVWLITMVNLRVLGDGWDINKIRGREIRHNYRMHQRLNLQIHPVTLRNDHIFLFFSLHIKLAAKQFWNFLESGDYLSWRISRFLSVDT